MIYESKVGLNIYLKHFFSRFLSLKEWNYLVLASRKVLE
ncbi:hypothetical protein KIS4809_2970 [Bacillus sp. ZZV12-4809]|nr:hypothetical protein KIS4809_2970 [Bacillus sp. ZZV12-4809]